MNALIEFANNHKEGKIDSNDISRFPISDVAEVVRCKDCKHYDEEDGFCGENQKYVMQIDYCSYGERKEK